MSGDAGTHRPVMVREVVAALAPGDGSVVVDGTFGGGGYAAALLNAAACRVVGIDRDPDAVRRGQAMADRSGRRLAVLHGRYGDMVALLDDAGVSAVDGVALDLGFSSHQIEDADRGFSFRIDGPLDMRMERDGPTAADVVNGLSEAELAEIIGRLGEERAARRIARAIVRARAAAPIVRTGQLADVVRRVTGRSHDGIDPATRTFQALRIYVNDELGELDRGLVAAERLLRPGGRLAVVSFHSLEDRRVKEFLRRRTGGEARPSRHQPDGGTPARAPSFHLLRRGAAKATPDEVTANPRARSARLRAAERTAAPAWPAGDERGTGR